MTATEMQQQLDSINSTHGTELIHLVTTHLFCSSLLDHFGRAHGQSLQENIHTLDRMTLALARELGFDNEAVHAARRSIYDAGIALKRLVNPR